MTYTRITIDPEVMAGVPTIRGMRIPVATVVAIATDGMAVEEICQALPDLEPQDVTEALLYSATEGGPSSASPVSDDASMSEE